MNKHSYFLLLWVVGLLLAQPSHAQYVATPPVQNGRISDAEYQNNVYQTAEGGRWYMTWDSNNLYIAKTGGQRTEPTILYLDLDPTLPVTGTSDAQGNLTGNPDFGVTPSLPFRADVRIYINGSTTSDDQYIEVRRRTGNGGWSTETTAGLFAADGGTTNREARLSWNTLTGGGTIPPSFNWLGYALAVNGNPNTARYDQAPISQNGLSPNNGGINPQVGFYFTVINTANQPPFNLTSYTFVSTTSVNSFPGIDVWDFTMGRQADLYLSRGTTGGTWNIRGSLVVSASTLYFGNSAGSSFGDTNVGNIRTLGNGVLNMDATNKPINVREDVVLAGGSQLVLAGSQGGDLNVGRDFIVTNGTTTPATFRPESRRVTFVGNSIAHNIRTDNNYALPFAFLTVNSPSSTVTLNNDISVATSLDFVDGLLYTGSHTVQLASAASLYTETAGSHIIGNVSITQDLSPSNTTSFGNIGLRLIPQSGATAQNRVTLTRVTGTSIPGVGTGTNSNSIQRYFRLTTSSSIANPNFLVELGYRLDELNGLTENNLALYQSLVSATGPYTRLTTPPTANTSTHTLTYNYQMALAGGDTYLTLADGTTTPLPVTLVSFTAQATAQGNALLRWATASEKNSKGFGIERQLGNGVWQSVGYVAATNHTTGDAYSFADVSLAAASASAQAYYRLRQEDFDGTLTYSPVTVVGRPAAADATQLVLSPVPVSGASLSLTFAEAGQAGSDITVSNAQGQRMLHFTTEASTDVALSLPVANLAPGVYIVRVQAAGQGARFARFVKQ